MHAGPVFALARTQVNIYIYIFFFFFRKVWVSIKSCLQNLVLPPSLWKGPKTEEKLMLPGQHCCPGIVRMLPGQQRCPGNMGMLPGQHLGSLGGLGHGSVWFKGMPFQKWWPFSQTRLRFEFGTSLGRQQFTGLGRKQLWVRASTGKSFPNRSESADEARPSTVTTLGRKHFRGSTVNSDNPRAQTLSGLDHQQWQPSGVNTFEASPLTGPAFGGGRKHLFVQRKLGTNPHS